MEVLKEPGELEQANRQIMIKDLDDVYKSVEKLIQRTYMNKETDLNFQLRNIKTDISQLLSDIKSKNLDAFSFRKGTLNEFYQKEERLLEKSARMKDIFSSLMSSQSIDVFMLEDLLSNFKNRFSERISVDSDIQKEFKLRQMEASSVQHVMTGKAEKPRRTESGNFTGTLGPSGRTESNLSSAQTLGSESSTAEKVSEKSVMEKIETEMLSKLYNYMNTLEHKYSMHQPEILFNGNYIGDRKWKFTISDRYIIGNIMHSVVKPILTLETYWHPFDELRKIMNFVQKEANTVPSGQYKSLCLINSNWNADIKEWACNYVHPRLVIYLYELEASEIAFNHDVDNADRLKAWHNTEDYICLEQQISQLILQDEPFEESDVTKKTGLNAEGAKKFLSAMMSENKIIDVGFGTSRYSGMKDK